jgi:hypothetical protein
VAIPMNIQALAKSRLAQSRTATWRRTAGVRTPKLLVPLLALTLSSAVLGVPPDVPCIPEGGSGEVELDRPPIDGNGMPANAEWIGGDGAPEGLDVDGWSGSDPLGDATVSNGGGTASVPLHNSGGEIFGPNGHDVEGGLEGECLEVTIVWHYRYKVMQVQGYTRQISFAPKGIGGHWSAMRSTSTWIWRYAKVSRGPEQVCPC